MTIALDIGTLVSLLWPFAFVALAWGISIWALNQSDPQAQLVRRLTTRDAPSAPDARPQQILPRRNRAKEKT